MLTMEVGGEWFKSFTIDRKEKSRGIATLTNNFLIEKTRICYTNSN